MLARNPTNKKKEPRSARAERVEEIRKEISECLANARQACKDNKDTYQYDRLHDYLRAEYYQAKKLPRLTDAALLKRKTRSKPKHILEKHSENQTLPGYKRQSFWRPITSSPTSTADLIVRQRKSSLPFGRR